MWLTLSSLSKKVKVTQSCLTLCNPKDYTVNVFQILAQISPQWSLPLSFHFILQTILSLCCLNSLQFGSLQSLRGVWLFTTPWTAAHQASLSITNSQGLLKLHRVSDAIQSSHSLSSPSPPAFDLSQHQDLFQWVSFSHQVAKVLEFQLQFKLGWEGLDTKKCLVCSWSAVLKQFIVYGGAASWIQMVVCQVPSKEGPGFEKCWMLLDFIL